MQKQAETRTHFGFREVAAEEKAPLVRGVFDRVAKRYDLMNDLMSLGTHRLWKEALINALRPQDNMQILDLAGGTGDIAFRILRRAPEARLTLCDINAQMLKEGRNRAIDRNILHGIEWLCANAEALPLADLRFDACTLAFGIRNMTHPECALAEIHRVLKPGGHFLCLELCPARHDWLKPAYDWYSFHMLPWLGKIVVGDDAPYRYLTESIRHFLPPKQLAQKMEQAGFANVRWQTMSGGIVALHSGWHI